MNFNKRTNKLPQFIALAGACLLSACATQKPEIVTEVPPEPAPKQEIVYKNFEPETLYSLIVAELAGDRQRYDIALRNYLQQAHHTRDPAIAARATRIAQFLGAHQFTLNASLLWHEIEPENQEAQIIAATELTSANRLIEAIDLAKQIDDPSIDSLYITIAARADQATDIERERLLTTFNELNLAHPDKPALLVGLGLLHAEQNDFDLAITLARQVQKQDPQNVAAIKLEAESLAESGQLEKAKNFLLEKLEQQPTSVSLRLHYARLLAKDDVEASREQFRILNQQKPGDPDFIFSLALLNHELGDLDNAKELYGQLVHTPERGTSANYYLGEIAREQGNDDLALSYYLEVKSGPDFFPALERSTDILISKGENTEANSRFANLREQFPEMRERLYLAQANSLVRHKQLKPAVELLTEALSFDETNSSLLYARAMANEQRDLIHLTEEDLRTILQYDSNNVTALNALGYTLADRTDRYSEAYELIKSALELNPQDPAIVDSMGWVQYKLGNYQNAIEYLRKAMAAFPDHEVAAHLGEVLWVTGETEEAQTIWNKGLELNPNSDIIPGVMKKLKGNR
ncbi:tetratricopeptide repeat protein [Sessilibacter sp. MAH4]